MDYRIHPDGQIYLGDFVMTVAEFAAQRPQYTPCTGKTLRYDGSVLVVSDGSNEVVTRGSWPEGDSYIASAAAIIAAVTQARIPPPPPPSDRVTSTHVAFDGKLLGTPKVLGSGFTVVVGRWVATWQGGSDGNHVTLTKGNKVVLTGAVPNQLILAITSNGDLTIQGSPSRTYTVSLDLFGR